MAYGSVMYEITYEKTYEKTADKMFEELGYRKREDGYCITYISKDENERLKFWLEDKEVSRQKFLESGYISMQELKAINKKCEELGWI